MNAAECYGGRCFGTNWHSDLDLDLFDRVSPSRDGEAIDVRLVTALDDRKLRRISPRMQLAEDGFRLHWEDEATFDAFADGVINTLPGDQWRGALPATFFSTVTATMLALRGLLPMHMSSVVLNGRAVLIGGESSAGKSTVTAQLVGAGAQFLADDLTILRPEAGLLLATRGRPTMSLYPQVAAQIDCQQTCPLPDDSRGKLLAWPRHRAADKCFPIGGIIFLDRDDQRPLNAEEKLRLLARAVFRPKILSRTPAARMINQQLLGLASTQRIMVLPKMERHETSEREARLERLLACMEETGEH